MNPVEDALIRRLDARHAFAKVLRAQTPRNRGILVAAWRDGYEYREIGKRLGLSSARVGQIHAVAFDHVREVLKERTLSATSLRRAPPGFDKAAFLDHMRGLVRRREEKREEAKRGAWRKELEVMSHFLKMATPDPPQPRQPVAPPPQPPPVGYWFDLPPAPRQNVEPWFDPARTPTLSDLRCIAQYALGYFRAARGLGLGIAGLGTQLAEAVCARDADMIAVAMQRWAKEIPPQARFSVQGMAMLDGMLGVSVASPHLAMQAVSVDEGRKVSLMVTYDV